MRHGFLEQVAMSSGRLAEAQAQPRDRDWGLRISWSAVQEVGEEGRGPKGRACSHLPRLVPLPMCGLQHPEGSQQGSCHPSHLPPGFSHSSPTAAIPTILPHPQTSQAPYSLRGLA